MSPRFPPRSLVQYAIAIAASIGFAVIAAELRNPFLDKLDVVIEMAIHELDSPIGDVVMAAATVIGMNFVLLPTVAAVAVLALRRRRRAVAFVLAINAIVVIIADVLLKLIFGRARPRLFEKINLPADFSFPSGHAMSAMAIYGAIAVAVIALYPRTSRPAIIAAACLIVLIGMSRIYLGVHWPFDVLAGYLAGIPPLVVSAHVIHRSGGA